MWNKIDNFDYYHKIFTIFAFSPNAKLLLQYLEMRPKEIAPEDKDLYEEIGKSLKDLRTARGISYVRMSKEIGIARNSFNQMELGKLNFQL